jgi:hypothetical protein
MKKEAKLKNNCPKGEHCKSPAFEKTKDFGGS